MFLQSYNLSSLWKLFFPLLPVNTDRPAEASGTIITGTGEQDLSALLQISHSRVLWVEGA